MKKIISIFTIIAFSFSLQAKEGMWIPYLIGQLNHQEMKEMGLELSAEDIYSINNTSLKDAIVHFNGGCTSSLISSKGLLLTNHHCGYSQIQSHSSLENNYLKDGFWAMSLDQELKNPRLSASIVKYLEDVTNKVLEGYSQDMSENQKDSIIKANAKLIISERQKIAKYNYEIKPFFYGNQYILIAKEQFKDVRLVGAPPSSIGKFGADTDNWMWPRHTGDFSIFRIYAGKDNKPAEVSDENVPYTPKEFLKINVDGVQPGDFTMVYGFPGSTQQYLPAAEVNNIVEEYNPLRISIRDEILKILDRKMRIDEATRIKYASKYASTSNSYKRWKGEIKGLKETNGIERIRQEERAFAGKINRKKEELGLEEYENIIERMLLLYEERVPLNKERFTFIEAGYYGQELMRLLLRYNQLVHLVEDGKEEAANKEGERLANAVQGFYKDFDAQLEREIVQAILPIYLKNISTGPIPETIAELQTKSAADVDKAINTMFDKNPVLNKEEWPVTLENNPKKAVKQLKKSTAFILANEMYEHYLNALAPKVREIDQQIEKLQAKYVEGLQKAFPEKAMYPDANSTLRIAYGKVKPYNPSDAVTFYSHTFLGGVMEKYKPGDYEFDVPQKLIDLYNAKDFGEYGEDGKMPVCFVATNHTTGGNSGSPVLNGRGELVGLNFDRAWEGVMSDMFFDTTRCRNVMVDLRYVLFIVDKFANAQYLIEEMDLVKNEIKQEEATVEEQVKL